ncbi:uncharacterized protein LOC141638901 [Silene latifolia]|uniref:uncharacterized protein LOC141638901 n=1 Tax=Silene latifolia TaxID=37657 RepID=UPI003D779F60
MGGGKRPELKDVWLDLNNSHMASLQVRHLFHLDGKWNADFIDAVFKDEWTTRILAIPPCEIRLRDKVFWPLTKDGTYTVKSGYGLIFDRFMSTRGTSKDRTRINDRGREFCRKTLWNLPVPMVWKILFWKIIINALPTESEFHKRKLNVEPLCGMCGGDQKSIKTPEHLFRDCGLASRIWAGSVLGIRVDSAGGISVSEWIYDWIRYLSNSEGGEGKTSTFVAILWGLWTLRNNVIFQELVLNPHTITGCFYNSIREKVHVLCNASPTKQPQLMLRSSEEGSDQEDREAIRNGHPVNLVGNQNSCAVVRVKVDACWVRNFEAAVGWVAFDHTGKEIERRQMCTRAESALQAEALGVRDVLVWAQAQRVLHIDLSSDCLQLINQIAGVDKEDHMIAGIREDIRERLRFFHCLCLNFIPRRLNNLAHGLAKHALRL